MPKIGRAKIQNWVGPTKIPGAEGAEEGAKKCNQWEIFQKHPEKDPPA